MATKEREYRGMVFADVDTLKLPIDVEIAVSGTEKLVIKAPLSVETHKGSYKFPDQCVLSCWSTQYPELRPRGVSASKYWRLELVFPSMREARDFFSSVACRLDAILKGVI